jgi:DUF1365 family protein
VVYRPTTSARTKMRPPPSNSAQLMSLRVTEWARFHEAAQSDEVYGSLQKCLLGALVRHGDGLGEDPGSVRRVTCLRVCVLRALP